MRWLLLLLFIPVVAAGGVHDGPAAVTMSMYIHHTADGLLLHPTLPTSASLEAGPAAVACGEPAVWTVPFTRNLDDPTDDRLARAADFDPTAPRLTWLMETVVPATNETLPRMPLTLTISAQLRSGDDVLASGSTQELTPVQVEGRNVVKAEFGMSWADPAGGTIPAGGLSLRVVASIADPADCGAAPLGLRAYADADHHNRILWDLYDPVRLDLFELDWAGETLLIHVHASSPWGAFDLAAPQVPVLTTPKGPGPVPVLDALDDAQALAATWSWDTGGADNGTYRVDIVAASADGTNKVDAFTTFKVGGNAPVVVPETASPSKDAPGFAAPLGLLALAFVRRISR